MAMRVHYLSECENTSGNDTLAMGTQDAMDRVNCGECLIEMRDMGFFEQDDINDHLDDY